MSWQIEIQDASLVWQDVSAGQIRSISAGTSSESQIIPQVNITFAADVDLPVGLLDPETNREAARLRITDEDITRFFRIERQPGSVSRALDYPQLTGRAWAGIITEWPAVTHDWTLDTYASDMARQICTRNVATQTGAAVSVVWLASQDPVIPGGRFQVSRRERWALLKELVQMCGARIRVSTNGMGFEVYDGPAKALTSAATRTFTDAQSLSYELQRVKQPGNACRVQGEQADYTRPTLPVVRVAVSPNAMQADGITTATATATVYDSSGLSVQHKAIIDEPITAGSYTAIPVSGCYAVQAVWLNTGTAQAPVKGSRVTPSGFTASEITVPDNGTQLFIVSYTRAEQVSWALADQADEIEGEAQTTTGALAVSTSNPIGRVIGVYRAGDRNRSGVNYFTGGSYTANTTGITLGITPGPTGTAVIIDYEEYNGAPLSASISPATALCNASGQATATIGSGTTVGTAKVIASALGQEGYAWLSLLGSSIASISLTSDKAQLLAGSSVAGMTVVNEQNLVLQNDEEFWNSQTMRWEAYQNGDIALEGYVVVSNPSAGSVQFTCPLTNCRLAGSRLVNGEYRIYFRIVNGIGEYQYFTVGQTTIDVSYNTTADIENAAGSCTLTATVSQGDSSPVSDGTQVDFSLSGLRDCTLSSTRVYTSGGVATTVLSAGSSIGRATVRAVCGSQTAWLNIEVVRVITDDAEVGTISYPTGTDGTADGDGADAGGSSGGSSSHPADSSNGTNICGSRRLVGCNNEPLSNEWVTLLTSPTVTRQTDVDGWFGFCVPAPGVYEGSIEINGAEQTFTWNVAAV